MPEYWSFGSSQPTDVGRLARVAEEEGWDGLVFTDSQNLRMDVYVVMATAAAATSRLKVSPGVTNPVTRHAAVSASAIAAIQSESAGRASYGIGRGDSALAYLGMAPCSLSTFERYVRHVQAFLSGGSVPFAEIDVATKSVSTLELGDQPAESWLRWIDPSVPKVPVEVVGTGPKVIAIGGRHADLVTLTVGADLDRLSWGRAEALDAAHAAGRLDDPPAFGAYVNVTCHPDVGTARTLISGGLAAFSRFSAMHGSPSGPLSAETASVVRSIRDSYDMKHHGEPGSAQTGVMTDEFIDRFAVVGDPDTVVARITEIVELGFDRIVLTPPNQASRDRYPDETAEANDLLLKEVLPRLPR